MQPSGVGAPLQPFLAPLRIEHIILNPSKATAFVSMLFLSTPSPYRSHKRFTMRHAQALIARMAPPNRPIHIIVHQVDRLASDTCWGFFNCSLVPIHSCFDVKAKFCNVAKQQALVGSLLERSNRFHRCLAAIWHRDFATSGNPRLLCRYA